MSERKAGRSHAAQNARSARRLLVLAGWIAGIAILLHGFGALSASEPPDTPASAAPASGNASMLGTMTVEERKKLERQVNRYVSTVVVRYINDSLVRWDVPICPLVAGLPHKRGEFILWRITQIAAAVGAPMAGEHCKVNFFVVVTPQPDELLKLWLRRDPHMYDTTMGMPHIKSFMRSPRPIRCWYNTEFRSSDGRALASDAFAAGVPGMGMQMMPVQAPTSTSSSASRLGFTAVQTLSSVIIVVDMKRAQELTLGQLSDYIALVGLAEIHLDGDVGSAPTILRLFQTSTSRPEGLSEWDQAFLHALYNTSQSSVMQASSIKQSMVKRIVLQ
ncbi:MAG TPA: hypothetical protein VE046_01830 [Steroidobacteraceae bacterium]|nr:hypothetical protein [Steroidobacteraceae bacterium]